MACVFTLTGASGCGKSEIIKILKKLGENQKYKDMFSPIIISKYTTRPFRSTEIDMITNGQRDDLDVRPVFGINNIVVDNNGIPLPDAEQNDIRMQLFGKLGCDLAYEQYGNRYGIQFSEIFQYLKQGMSPIIVLNDIRVVEDIKTYLGNKCISLFVFRNSPKLEEYMQLGELRQSSLDDVQTRYNKATAIYRIYIENIHIFDKLVLNVQNNLVSLSKILEQIVEASCNTLPIKFYNRYREES